MEKNNKEQDLSVFEAAAFTPYSQTTAAAYRPLVEAVGDGGFTRFATKAHSLDGGASYSWLKARRNPATGRWMLFSFRSIGAPDDPAGQAMISSRDLHLDLCFFDALHQAAKWSVAQGNLVMFRDAPAAKDEVLPDCDAVIAALKFPRDLLTNLPAPVLDGDIIGPGTFASADFDSAAQGPSSSTALAVTRADAGDLIPVLGERKIPTEEEVFDLVDMADDAYIALEEEIENEEEEVETRLALYEEQLSAALEAKREKIEQVQELENAAKSAGQVTDIVLRGLEENFGQIEKFNADYKAKIGIQTAMGGLNLSLGILALAPFSIGIGVMCSIFALTYVKAAKKETSAKHILHNKLDNLDEQISLLPGEQEKKLCRDFAKVARMVFGMEHLAYLHTKGKIKKGNKVIEQMVADLDISADQAQRLRTAFNGPGFGAPGSFLPRLEEAQRVLESELAAASLRILKPAESSTTKSLALPAPPAI